MNLALWLRTYWRDRGNARRVLDGYQALARTYPELLADIGLRGNLFTVDYRQGLTARDDAIREGRRQLALEIFKAARLDPAQAYALIEQREPEKAR